MRHRRQRSARLLTISIVLLTLLTAVSFKFAGQVVWRKWHVAVLPGGVRVGDVRFDFAMRVPKEPAYPVLDVMYLPGLTWSRFAALNPRAAHFFWRPQWHWIFVPFSVPITLLVVARLLLVFWRKTPRETTPLCGRCSYDLTGNLSGVCPECGTPATASRPMPTSLRRRKRRPPVPPVAPPSSAAPPTPPFAPR